MIKTAPIFQNSMVLQREKPVPVWGTAKPGTRLTVTVQGVSAETVCQEDGSWMAVLPPLAASCEETMVISSEEETIRLEEIAVGEVWLAGGQSNMEFHMRYEKHKEEAFKDCDQPFLRFFDVPEVCYDGQEKDFDYSRMNVWRKADPENLDHFSAVGYYFQKQIAQKLDVPVGIVGCNWGGTTTCAWMTPETTRRVGAPWLRYYEEQVASLDMDAYWKAQHTNPANNRGNLFDPFAEMLMPRTLSEEEEKGILAAIEKANKKQKFTLQPQALPGCLYEHMLKQAAPFAVRGVLWYQGESDDEVPGMNVLHRDMLTGMIADWRALWKDELPFLIVQLPGFSRWMLIRDNHYPIIRQCQQETADTVSGVYLCSISDVGEERDIHPKDKKTVGERLSLLARHYVYGEELLCDAPRAVSAKRNKNQIEITFANAGEGLYIQGKALTAMRVLAGDRELPFQAGVSGDRLLLTLEKETDEPVTATFAKTSWYLVNLYNSADIPAIPFLFTL